MQLKSWRPRSMAGWYRSWLLLIDLPWVLLWYGLTYLGLPWVLAVIGAASLPMGSRYWWLIHMTFSAARKLGIKTTALTPAQRRRMIWQEYVATLRMFCWLMPFREGTRSAAGQGQPILLVHGIICNSGVWRPFARWLARQGEGPIESISLYPPFASLDEYAEQLHLKIEAVCATQGVKQLRLVAHSMGGVVSRAYLHRYGGSRVSKVVTLGSPHQGVYVKRGMLRIGENVRQLRIKSDWMLRMQALEAQPCPAPIVSIWSPHENVILPQDSSLLTYPNARNINMPGVGHNTLLYSPAVWKEVLKALR